MTGEGCRIGRLPPEGSDEQRQGDSDADGKPADATLPVEAAPQGEEEDGIVGRTHRHPDEEARGEGEAVGGDRPDHQRPRQGVVDPSGHDRRVREEEVEHGRGDPEAGVLEVPPAGEDHPRDDRQLREDRHHAGGGLIDDPGVAGSLDGPLAVGLGGEDPLRRDPRQEEEKRIAGPESLEGIGFVPRLDWLDSGGGSGGRRDVGLLGARRDHVGQQEHEERTPQKHQPTGGEVRLEERPADHHRVEQHPHQERR